VTLHIGAYCARRLDLIYCPGLM